MGIAPTCEQVAHMAIMIARNDANNPKYHIEFNYMWTYLNICFRENTLEWETNLRSQIVSEWFQNKKMQQLLQLHQERLVE